MRDQVLSSVGAQDMDSTGQHVVDLDVLEIYSENDQFDEHAFFKSGIDSPFYPATFDISEMCAAAAIPILLDEVEDKEIFPPTTPVSE